MKIEINHLAKMEGHASFLGALEEGNIAQAKIITEEGVRLVEGCLLGKSMYDAHIITMRICGICPIVHNLTAIKAMEDALDIKVSAQTIRLRKLMELAQLIHSHSMHLYFLSLPDFVNNEETLKLLKRYPKQAQIALRLREFGNSLNEVIGGRAIHPINNWLGGFKVTPKEDELKEIEDNLKSILKDAIIQAKFFAKLKYPKFNRETEFVTLSSDKEYAIYDGKIMTSNGMKYRVTEFNRKMQEVDDGEAMAKRALWYNSHFMVGALARVNNHGNLLNKEAKAIWQKTHKKKKVFNTYYNVLAQAVEVVHCVEEVENILKSLNVKKEKPVKYKVKAGIGIASVEAPRGILIHRYEIDSKGRIKQADVITPTVMFLGNLEDDLAKLLPSIKSLTPKATRNRIRTLIRAYDPCISCATH
nr:hypothetical protein [bacterium]